jgi:hypothetical protein
MEQEPFRLRMKIGTHEFEAAGDRESVERQFAIWRDLISTLPATSPSPPPQPASHAVSASSTSAWESLQGVSAQQNVSWENRDSAVLSAAASALDTLGYDKIFHRGGKVVSLTVLPNGDNRDADAALLILLGQRHYNQLDRVTGSLMLAGLQQSGINAERVDRVLERYSPEFVLRDGIRRAVRYRLNNQGYNRARELARELVAMLP